MVLYHGDRPWSAPDRVVDLFERSDPGKYRLVAWGEGQGRGRITRRPRGAGTRLGPQPYRLRDMAARMSALRMAVEQYGDADLDAFLFERICTMLELSEPGKRISDAAGDEPMSAKTTLGRTERATAVAVATLFITVLAPPTGPLAAQNVIELPAEDRPLDADFEVIYRVGSLDGDGWDTFGRVARVGFDGAGNLYILDTQVVRINVVDLQANLVRQFIREGQGPGEFGSNTAAALGFAVMRDGRVTVYDLGRMGFSLFGADGEFERTVRLPGTRTSSAMIAGIQAFPGMDRVLATSEVNYLGRTETSPDDEPSEPSFRHVLSYDLSGDQVRIDSIAAGWGPSW